MPRDRRTHCRRSYPEDSGNWFAPPLCALRPGNIPRGKNMRLSGPALPGIGREISHIQVPQDRIASARTGRWHIRADDDRTLQVPVPVLPDWRPRSVSALRSVRRASVAVSRMAPASRKEQLSASVDHSRAVLVALQAFSVARTQREPPKKSGPLARGRARLGAVSFRGGEGDVSHASLAAN